MTIWNRLLHNWRAKLGSLLAAAVIWYLLHQGIGDQTARVRPAAGPVTSGRFP